MKNTEGLYVQILRWAYDKHHVGFTEVELLKQFDLDNDSGRKWYVKVFRDHTVLIDPMYNSDKWTLTAAGMSAAVDYLELKEAQAAAEHAKIIAYWSIGIAIIVGVVQVILTITQLIHTW